MGNMRSTGGVGQRESPLWWQWRCQRYWHFVCILIALLAISQLSLVAEGANLWRYIRERVRRRRRNMSRGGRVNESGAMGEQVPENAGEDVAEVERTGESGASGSGTEQGYQGVSASRTQQNVPQPPRIVRETYTRVFETCEAMYEAFPRRRTSTGPRTPAFVHNHLKKVAGRAALAAILESRPPRDAAEWTFLFIEGQHIVMKSAALHRLVRFQWIRVGDQFYLRNEEGQEYSASLMFHFHGEAVRQDTVHKVREGLAGEFQLADTLGLNTLEEVQARFRLLTFQDILLFPERKPFTVDRTRVYLNAIFLYHPTVASLSSLLPLGIRSPLGDVEKARLLEKARLSFSQQVIYIVGKLAAHGLLLPRFSATSFRLTKEGIVYLMAQPPPRRSTEFRLPLYMPGQTPPRLSHRSLWSSSFSPRKNTLDLAVVLHNLWCESEEEFLPDALDAITARVLLTDAHGCYASIPERVRNLLAALAAGRLATSSILGSPELDALLDRLEEMEGDET